MNIVLVPNSYLPNIGGLEIVVSHISREFISRGHTVSVITGNSSPCYSKEVDPFGVKIYRVPFFLPRIVTAAGRRGIANSIRRTLLAPLFAPLSLFRFFRILKSIKPDIVNLHYVAENAVFCLFAKWLSDFKYIVSLHGNDIDRYPERSFFSRWVTKQSLLSADRIFTNSADILEKAEKIEPCIRKKSLVMGNAVYPELFRSGKKFHHPQSYILCVANFVPKKGQDLLIRAFHHVRKEYPHIDLILAGDGPEKDKCRALSEKLGLVEAVFCLGRVKETEIPSLLSGCTLFALPSRKEPFGVAVLEAMAAGRPVVATDVGGVKEIIQNGKNGLLVKPESPEALAQGIKIVLSNPEVAERMVISASKTVREKYSWPRIIERYLKNYQECMGNEPNTLSSQLN